MAFIPMQGKSTFPYIYSFIFAYFSGRPEPLGVTSVISQWVKQMADACWKHKDPSMKSARNAE